MAITIGVKKDGSYVFGHRVLGEQLLVALYEASVRLLD